MPKTPSTVSRTPIESADPDGKTALHHAIDLAATDAVRVLIDGGADVNALDRWDNSPLWRAVYQTPGTTDIIELLLQNGADPTVKNRHGVSPIDLAHSLAGDHDEIAGLLPKLEAAGVKFVDRADK
jgi:ankyrin repeat protein